MKNEIILKSGITGFSCESEVKKKDIDSFIYTFCRTLDYKLEQIISPKIAINYFRIILSKRDEKIELICNQAYPLMATTKPVDELSC